MTSSYLSSRALGRVLHHVWRLCAGLGLATSALLSAYGGARPAEAAGTISGTAFQDFNQDGVNNTTASAGLPAVDLGVAGVQVRAYDSSGTLQGSATTGANGSYTLSATGTGPYRVEFTVPAGYQPSGQGAGNGTTIQFVPDGGGTANLGLTIPSDYCQNNPLECTPRYINGDAAGGTLIGNTGGLVAFPENSTSATGAGLITSTVASNVGATWGLAWHRNTNTLFAGALAKRHSSFGPGGSDAIYRLTIDPTTGVASATSVFVDLTTLTGGPADTGSIAARDLVSGSYTTPSYDADAFAKVGKIALGDLDLSDDGQTLYVMSLNDQTLYALAIGPNATAPTSATGTLIALPGGATACPQSDLRPWAVEANGGSVYVGVVCSAETSHNRADLRAYVLRLNGGAFDLVTEFALNYSRGCTSIDGGSCYPAEWQPWRDIASSVCDGAGVCDVAFGKQIIYPQPILSDIEFDRDGALVLGFMDRSGNQWGNNNYGPGSASGPLTVSYINATGVVSTTASFAAAFTYEGAAAGDLIRLCPNGGGFTIESNASCGGTTTGGAGSSPAQGPGGGEYYWQDMYTLGGLNAGTHNEITVGGLKLVPGRTEIGTTVFDPNDDFRAGGIAWFGNSTGARTHSFEIFGQDSAGSMGKAGGLGDLEALCANAPIEIGNRVWVDADRDGLQDAGESPISNVIVNLFNQGGTQIGTATTDANGAWYFGGVANRNLTGGNVLAPNTAYEVRVPLSQSAITTPNYTLTTANVGANGSDSIDSDASTATGNAVIALTTGSAGANNHTYDIGFSTGLALGNLVWGDLNNNGTVDGGETGIDGVSVALLTSTGTPITSTTTAGGGLYLFSNLAPGDYIVRVTPPAGLCSSTGAPGSATGPFEGNPGTQPPDPDNDVNNDDNGNGSTTCGQGGYVIDSSIVTLALASEPVNDGDADSFTNLSVDFGLIGTLSLGNLVWHDVNNNGLVDGGEAGIDGATVRLLNAGGTTITSTTTAGGGLYLFSNLTAGDYIVEVVPPAGYCSSTGAAGVMTGSGPYEGTPGSQPPDPDNNVNNDDNGNAVGTCGQGGYAVRSAAVTLSTGAEPTNDGDADANSNLSVDFGLFQPVSLGNLVWSDSDNSGTVNGGEAGLNGVTVRLYTSGGALVTTTTTAGGGLYGFASLAPGDYIVEIVPPANTCSSTGTAGSATGPYEGTPGSQPPDPDNDVNNDDNGYHTAGCGSIIRTAPVTLASGAEPTTDGDADSNSNLTVDFGLIQIVSLGNLVWNDSDNNGLVNGGEAGVDGVPVRLYSSGGTLISSTVTAGGGLYGFTNLTPGDYVVEITPATGACSSSGTPGSGTGPYEGNPAGGQPPDPDNDVNGDDNGNGVGTCGQPGYVVRSGVVTLTVGGEPTNDGDGNTGNQTVDFGLVGTLSLGNLVWNDADNSGTVNGSETGINGVTVRLLSASGTVLATTTTAGGGLYSFTNLVPGDYLVEVVPPAGYCSSTGTAGSAAGPYEGTPGTQPPDPDNNVNNDDNGNAVGTCGQPGYAIRSSAITLTVGGEPTNDGDSDANSNLTVDFGLVLNLSLGNLVWNDVNNNGLVDGGEAGVDGLPVRLYTSTGTLVATTTTAGGGLYSFVNLPAGDYYIEVTPTTGACSSSGTPGSGTGPYEGNPAGGQPPDPDNNVNGDDNGNGVGTCGQPGYIVRSGTVTLSAGGEPTNDGDSDANSNLTIDFGLTGGVSLGNLVWGDADNNGLVNGAETGINGVTVRLYASTGTLITTTVTAGGGLYTFASLLPGDYVVEIVPPSGYCSSTGTPGSATGPYEGTPGTQPPDPDNNVNSDDNGYGVGSCGLGGYVIRSSVVTLTAGGEPTGDGDNDTNSNLTVDFGILQPASLGNFVWNDANNNGVQDPGELGVGGVTVTLRNGSGTTIITTTTAPDGTYLFPNLLPGTYSVCFSTIPLGSSLTSQNAGGNDAADSDADPNTGCTGTYTLTAGQQDLTVDAGLIGVPTAATLTSFTVTGPTQGVVTITWTTATEEDVFAFRVYRSSTGLFADASMVCERSATGADSAYSCTDTVEGTGPYTYWLTQVRMNGEEREITQPNTIGAVQGFLHIPSIIKP